MSNPLLQPHSERLARDIDAVRAFALKHRDNSDLDETFAVDIQTVVASMQSNLAKARKAETEAWPLAALNDRAYAVGAEAARDFGVTITDWPREPDEPSPGIADQFDDLTRLRAMLTSTLDMDKPVAREVRRLVSLIIKSEKLLYQSAVDGGDYITPQEWLAKADQWLEINVKSRDDYKGAVLAEHERWQREGK
jgi:hypothetical protein